MSRLSSLAALSLLLAVGCVEPLTQAILVVDTDIPLASPNPDIDVEPHQLREISISLYGPCPEDGTACPAIFEDSVQQYNLPGSVELPFSIGLLLEPEGDPGPYVVDLIATLGEGAGESTLDLDAEFEFVRGETHALPLHLLVLCRGVVCNEDETCGPSGACESTVRSGDGFPLWTENLADFGI